MTPEQTKQLQEIRENLRHTKAQLGRLESINDGQNGWDRVADNPRDRILAALYGIRDGYDPRERVTKA